MAWRKLQEGRVLIIFEGIFLHHSLNPGKVERMKEIDSEFTCTFLALVLSFVRIHASIHSMECRYTYMYKRTFMLISVACNLSWIVISNWKQCSESMGINRRTDWIESINETDYIHGYLISCIFRYIKCSQWKVKGQQLLKL